MENTSHKSLLSRRFAQEDLENFVGQALLNYQSSLSLAHSPLANSHLVTPALILDPISPTTEEKAVAMRLALKWVVSKLAPVPSQYPIGSHRPFDDPTWSDPRWWRYNILRHKFIEPIHPDDFVDGARETGTIIALTGIPSTATFFREQNRAIQEASGWVMQQVHHADADTELRQLAIQATRLELSRIRGARQVAEIASTFSDVFPRQVLANLAESEGLDDAEWIINELIRYRYLLSSDSLDDLWMSPVLCNYLYANQERNTLFRRHEQIADYYLASSNDVIAARHLHAACMYEKAALVLIRASPEYLAELDVDELKAGLNRFEPGQLSDDLWYNVQLLLSDLYRMVGEQAQAIVACRAALTENVDSRKRGIISHRLGKLYERLNQSHAMTYYQQALDLLQMEDMELAELCKDRGWLFILQDDLDAAMDELTRALQKLQKVSSRSETLLGDIYDAMATVYKRQKDFDPALDYGRKALRLREEFGNPLLVAKSHANLAWIYYEQRNFAHALSAFLEAAETFRQLNNQPLLLDMMINVGIVHHASGSLSEARKIYQACHRSSIDIEDDMKLAVSKINLAEVYAEMDEPDEALMYWKDAYALSLSNSFAGEINYLEKLHQRFPIFQLVDLSEFRRTVPARIGIPDVSEESSRTNVVYDYEEDTILEIARTQGYVSTGLVVEYMPISRATATRKLTAMVERGILTKVGKGRGTRYIPTGAGTSQDELSGSKSELLSRSTTLIEQVVEYRVLLTQQYALDKMYIVDEADDIGPQVLPNALNLLVEFSREPDLSTYFNLSAFLSELSFQPVHIIPMSVVSLWERDIMLSRAHRLIP